MHSTATDTAEWAIAELRFDSIRPTMEGCMLAYKSYQAVFLGTMISSIIFDNYILPPQHLQCAMSFIC